MKIAILNISIGEYECFWKEFYESAKKNFLIDCEKEFFVFTDSKMLLNSKNEDVHFVYQKDMGWPYNTMKRFNLFIKLKDVLKDFEYVFFVNGNAKFVYPLTSEIILKNKQIVTVEHPAFHYKKIEDATYEDRKISNAYVPIELRKVYVQGAFFGGTNEGFFNMVDELNSLVEDDLNKTIIAVWHDESFLNKYVAYHNNVQILGWQYLKYEECIQPYKPIIVLRNKRKYLNNKNGRYLNENFIKENLLMFLRNCRWLLLIIVGVYKKYSILDKESKYIDLNILE